MNKSLMRTLVATVGGVFAVLLAYGLFADGESGGNQPRNSSDSTVDFTDIDSVVRSIGLVVREDSKENEQQILRAVRRFAETCPTLFTRYAGDVVSATAYGKWVEMYREERYGWHQEVALEVRMDSHAPVAPGHLLTYYLGDGDRPGWITQKAQGLEPCQRDGNSSGDTFVPVHDLYQG
ncbi:hypothetical protein [Halomonas sp.]|uniref:hypothetical protein n=1 Tax=Halomonas sp. TaxID=1486246 RepID=UPI00298E4355|nr:hypothetical protein [Halomonas sp.]MDW7745876.1 hypothetical protein [Halomonas sp.]